MTKGGRGSKIVQISVTSLMNAPLRVSLWSYLQIDCSFLGNQQGGKPGPNFSLPKILKILIFEVSRSEKTRLTNRVTKIIKNSQKVLEYDKTFNEASYDDQTSNDDIARNGRA